jgi:hypothetical protein
MKNDTLQSIDVLIYGNNRACFKFHFSVHLSVFLCDFVLCRKTKSCRNYRPVPHLSCSSDVKQFLTIIYEKTLRMNSFLVGSYNK